MRRRDFLATSAAAAAGSSIVACRPPETAAAPPVTSGQWGSGDYSHMPEPGNLGGVHAVHRDAGTGALSGGSDPRRDGHAIAW
ncbi:hypothetical protein [Candidatus Palauibacter sp.]|uniref:hypothetical protein n=1 Tax=Candidatus Palauibacter sp. TaxID=3101350 RepID=UPI003B51ACCB